MDSSFFYGELIIYYLHDLRLDRRGIVAGLKVLLVDDEPAFLDVTRMFLQEQGFNAETIESPIAALDLLKTKDFDAIVSDYSMPEMDGLKLLKELRDRNDMTPFILFTGKGREEVVISAYELGADRYLQKGGDPHSQFTELGHAIRQSVQRKEAMNEFVKSERRFRETLENMDSIAVSIDRNGKVAFFNGFLLSLTGRSSDEVAGCDWFETFIPEDQRESVKHVFGEMIQGREPGFPHYSNDILTRSGERRTISWDNIVLKDAEGNITGTASIGRNETELLQKRNALEASERQLREIFDNASIGQSITAPDGKMLRVNQALSRMLGYSIEELQSMNYSDITHPDDMGASGECVRSLLSGERSTYQLAKRYIHKDGSTVRVEISTYLQRDSDGNPQFFITSIIDVTSQSRLSNSLKRINEKLELLSSITRHDVANQLSVLDSYLLLLAKDLTDKGSIELLNKAVDTSHSIHGMLSFYKEYQKAGTSEPRWFTLEEICKSGCMNIDTSAIEVEKDVGNWEIFADPMIDNVCYNLFINSLKHGMKVSKVKVSAKKEGSSLKIIYEDNGVGVPPDIKKTIFEYSHSPSGHGLYLAKDILGITEISIEEVGEYLKGARFVIKVPSGCYRLSLKK